MLAIRPTSTTRFLTKHRSVKKISTDHFAPRPPWASTVNEENEQEVPNPPMTRPNALRSGRHSPTAAPFEA